MLEYLRSWLARRSPQLEQPLPEHVVLYFDHLYSEYRSLLASSTPDQAITISPEVQTLVDEVVKKRQNLSLTWNDLYTLELLLTRLEPPEKLRRKVWSLRARYRDVAGLQEYEAYLASKPPELVDQPDAVGHLNTAAVQAWRADIEYLLSELYLRYAIAPVRERQRNRLSNWAAAVILVGLGIVLLFIFFAARVPTSSGASSTSTFWDFGVTTLTVVVFLGAMGGLVSVQQRLQNASDAGDQLYNVSELMHAKSILVSAVSGATFAAVLYLLITAGLLEGGLFPEIRTPFHDGRTSPAASPPAGGTPAASSAAGTSQGQTQQTRISFVQFLLQTSPESASDYAKLMIWSFLAGFAERLVPDTLSRVVARKETETKANT